MPQSSESHLLVTVEDELSETLRVDELGILALQVSVRDPTGLRAAASDVNPHLIIDRKLKQLLQRRHADAQQAIAHGILEDDRRVIREDDLDVVARLFGPFRNMER